MTTQPAPVPEGYVSADMLPPEDAAYVKRLKTALRCGVPGCSCADPGRAHCPSHDNAMVPTLKVTWNPGRGFDFECTRCSWPRVLDALAKRGLMPRSQLYTSTGAVEAGLHPLEFLIQQPPDWLWPNRIPLGKLTLIAGYPSSGKTSIAMDIAARVSRGAPAPDQPDALFPSAPVVLAILNGNPKSDVLPVLRLFGADLGRIYLADLITPTLPIDYYPDTPPAEDGPDDPEDEDEDWEEDEDDFADLRDTPLPRRRSVGVRLPARDPFEPPPRAASDSTAPWPSLNKVMKRLANTIEAGSAALLVVDQVEGLASMHRAQLTTVLGMLNALAARTGAAVIALTHNPAPNYPRAVTAMQRRLAQASVVFTTALVEPGERRFPRPPPPRHERQRPCHPFRPPPSQAFPRRSSASARNLAARLIHHSRPTRHSPFLRHSPLLRHSSGGWNPEPPVPRLRPRLAQARLPRAHEGPRLTPTQRRREDPCRPVPPHARPRRRPPPLRRGGARGRHAWHHQKGAAPRADCLRHPLHAGQRSGRTERRRSMVLVTSCAAPYATE